MSELKPCPFCGGEAKIDFNGIDYVLWKFVKCQNPECEVQTKQITQSDEQAIAAWNTRINSIGEDDEYQR